jgi:hypothetical protein
MADRLELERPSHVKGHAVSDVEDAADRIAQMAAALEGLASQLETVLPVYWQLRRALIDAASAIARVNNIEVESPEVAERCFLEAMGFARADAAVARLRAALRERY